MIPIGKGRPSIKVLGITVDMIEISDVVSQMELWLNTEEDQCHHVVNSGMHGIMEARRNPRLRSIFASVDLFAPDGILMVIVSRLRGFKIRKQNTGPDLLWKFAEISNTKGYTHYFYGDESKTLDLLSEKLTIAFPNIKISGWHSPPFRTLTSEEDDAAIQRINDAQPDVLWVGLGMPTQELWIAEHKDRLKTRIAVGAGASFKLISGKTKRSPLWLSNAGFEWMWRILLEPKRVWKRVFVDAPKFIALESLELMGIKKFE